MSFKSAAIAILLATLGCMHDSTTTTTWVAPAGDYWMRPGTVESVQQVVRRTQGDPVGGALVGALIGGILFHGHGPATLVGAAVGAAASQGTTESRTYQILIHFDDGERGLFIFGDYTPFRPGDRVALTPQGLRPMQ